MHEQLDLFGEPAHVPQVLEVVEEPEERREPVLDADGQPALFGEDELPIPEGAAEALDVHAVIYVHFSGPEDVRAFAEAVGQPVSSTTRVIRFPQGPMPKAAGYA